MVNGQEQYRGVIAPVAAEVERPLWSVMIPTYNCARYLRETLASVLAQAPGPEVMQIAVIDDCSTADDPAAVVAELGGGRVEFYRQPHNVGHTRNFDTCLQRARGQLVHLLHGDDCVRPGFYQTMQQPFATHPEIGAAFCRYIAIDERGNWQSVARLEQPESGILPNWLEQIAIGQRLQTPTMVVRREVYERLGGFDHRIKYYGEDWEMWVRIAANYPVWYEPEPLAMYRIHLSSLSGKSMRTGENGRDLRRATHIIQAYLPQERSVELLKQARENNALGFLRRARRILDAGDMRTPLILMREALKFSRSGNVVRRTAFLIGLWMWRTGRHATFLSRSANGTKRHQPEVV